MKGALQTLERVLFALTQAVRPGVTPVVLAAMANEEIQRLDASAILPAEVDRNGKPFGFAACVCVNDQAANAVPSMVPLEPGDLVTLDVALAWPARGGEGPGGARCVVDGATTCVVAGDAPDAAVNLRDAARAATRACLQGAHPGTTPIALRRLAHGVADQFGVSLAPIALVHRVNQGDGALHVVLPEHQPLQAGDVIAIEPLLVARPSGCELRPDGDGFTLRTADGSLAAYEECTMVVGDDESSPRIHPSGVERPWLVL